MSWPPKIEENVPLPETASRDWSFLDKLKLRESFLVESEKIAAAAVKMAKKRGITCSRAKVAEGFRVWRVG